MMFIWGPKKLPEMARSIGQAKREFEKSAKEISTGPNIPTASNVNAPEDPIIVAAKSLGITTEGKTKEDIAKEITARPTN